ncbi:MAG: type II toxin-antitoxin system RelE/ParE family toxin [Pseudoxanthomonas sp.]
MSGYALTPTAQADLSDIWDYSALHWSRRKADEYVRDIRDICEALAEHRLPGRDASNIRPGYRKQSCASHVLFYRTRNDGDIEIIRILHQRMDVASHLE